MPPTADEYRAGVLQLLQQQRGSLTSLIEQVDGTLAYDWQRGMGAAAKLYGPILDQYAKDLAALRAANDDPAARLTLDWLTSRNAQLASIQQSVAASAEKYGQTAAQRITQAQSAATDMAASDAAQLTQRSLWPAVEGAGVPPSVLFNRPNPDAIAQWVGRAGNGHPLGDLFSGFGAEATQGARQAMMLGLLTGANPKAMASGIANALGVSRSRATIISRTEVLGSYRSAAHETYRANSDVLDGWIWSAGGANPCAMCMGMDGLTFSLSEELVDHPCGKCAPIPVTKSWSDILGPLGIDTSDLEETSMGAEGAYETGPEKFARMSPQQQRAIIGTKTGYEAYQRGEVELKDFIGTRPAEGGFPAMPYQKSLREMEIPTGRAGSPLVEQSPRLRELERAGQLRARDFGAKIEPDQMPAWAQKSYASQAVYQIMRNGLPWNMAGQELPLLSVNIEQMLTEDLSLNVRMAALRLQDMLKQYDTYLERYVRNVTSEASTLGKAPEFVYKPSKELERALAAARAGEKATLEAAQAGARVAEDIERAYAPARATVSDAEAAARAEVKAARSQVNSLNRKLSKALETSKPTATLEADIAKAKNVLEQAQAKLDAQVAIRKSAEAEAKAAAKAQAAAERAAAREAAKAAKLAEKQAAAESKALRTGKPDVKPEAKFTRLVHANQKGDIASFADMHHMTVAEYEKAVSAKLAEMVDSSVVSVRAPQEALEKILDDGRLKTVHEAGTSLASPGARSAYFNETEEAYRAKVAGYSEMRAKYEKEAFGYPLDLPVELRPVSGYIAPLEGDDAVAKSWGAARIVLKDDVRARSTFTVGDSLQNYNSIPSPVNAPKYDAFVFQNGRKMGQDMKVWADLNDPLAMKDWSGTPLSYLEAQIHGGVRTSDIAEVVFDSGANPSAALIAKLQDAGIPWRMESGEAISAEKAAADVTARVVGEYQAKLDAYRATLDQSDPMVKQYLKDAKTFQKVKANERVTADELAKAEKTVNALAAQGKQATAEYRDAEAAYNAALTQQKSAYNKVNQALKNLRTRSPSVYKPELDSAGGFNDKLKELGIDVKPPVTAADAVKTAKGEAASIEEQSATTEKLSADQLTQLVADKKVFTDLNTGRTDFWTAETENGQRYIIRPADGPNSPTILMNELADRVGLGDYYLSAQTVESDGKWYEVQRMLEGKQADEAVDAAKLSSNAYMTEDERMKVSLFANLVGDDDRFANNMWITPDDKLVQIDYNMLFSPDPVGPGGELLRPTNNGEAYDAMIKALGALKPSPEVRAWMQDVLLSPENKQAIMQAVLKYSSPYPEEHAMMVGAEQVRLAAFERYAALKGTPNLSKLFTYIENSELPELSPADVVALQTKYASATSDAAFAASRAGSGIIQESANYELTAADKQFVAQLKSRVDALDQSALTHDHAIDIGSQIQGRIMSDPTVADLHDWAQEAKAIWESPAGTLSDAQMAWLHAEPDVLAAHGGVRVGLAQAQYQAEYQARVLTYLQEMREMGGAEVQIDETAAGYDLRVAKAVADVSDRIPRDWIEASNNLGDLNVIKNRATNVGGWYMPQTAVGADGIRISNDIADLAISYNRQTAADDIGIESSALHEMMHRMENAIPRLGQLERDYYNSRTAGEAFVDLGNGIAQKTKLDEWLDPYLGREPLGQFRAEYPHPEFGFPAKTTTSYELLSNGAEALLGGNASMAYLREDESFIHFILGLLAIVRADAPLEVLP